MRRIEYRCTIIEIVAELFPPEEQEQWMFTLQPALNCEWPSLAMQNGNEDAVFRLLLRLKQGN